MDHKKIICISFSSFCCVAISIASAIMLALSYYKVDPLTIALKMDNYTNTIDKDNVYGPGRYYLGLGFKMIEFPL